MDMSADHAVPSLQRVSLEREGVPAGGIAAGLANSGCYGGEEGRLWTWGMGGGALLAAGDADDDVPAPEKVKVTKKYNGWRTVQLEFGGQHAALLGVRREGYVVPEGAE